ncbi:18315_t:CDS:1, partial [Racocetra persica]
WIFGDRRTRLSISHLEAIAKVCAFYYTNIKKELHFYGGELLECDLKDSVNGSTINASQLETIDQNVNEVFKHISEPYQLQLDSIDDTNLSIEEAIDVSSPLFIGNNDSFIEEQSRTSDNSIQRIGVENTNYDPASV